MLTAAQYGHEWLGTHVPVPPSGRALFPAGPFTRPGTRPRLHHQMLLRQNRPATSSAAGQSSSVRAGNHAEAARHALSPSISRHEYVVQWELNSLIYVLRRFGQASRVVVETLYSIHRGAEGTASESNTRHTLPSSAFSIDDSFRCNKFIYTGSEAIKFCAVCTSAGAFGSPLLCYTNWAFCRTTSSHSCRSFSAARGTGVHLILERVDRLLAFFAWALVCLKIALLVLHLRDSTVLRRHAMYGLGRHAPRTSSSLRSTMIGIPLIDTD
ncbi:hypothetical protein FVE85_7119 [Porphyridium purpureum]|uniref:Uncharacterized protein n=1 Tax=Porphyridium purpureum TaxID=35688 RepID=A0A5J4Z969_PORPP|nr:hypothetical protein FVE85_7119 [Porphyridium purpureum]|eukprot:POR8576..scf295_1